MSGLLMKDCSHCIGPDLIGAPLFETGSRVELGLKRGLAVLLAINWAVGRPASAPLRFR